MAFGMPGLFMLIATLCFWLAKYKFVHIKPSNINNLNEFIKKKNLKIVLKLFSIFFRILRRYASIFFYGSHFIFQYINK